MSDPPGVYDAMRAYGRDPATYVPPVVSSTNSHAWWLCPNQPRCPHGAALHDIEDLGDVSPTCCVEGCRCGAEDAPPA